MFEAGLHEWLGGGGGGGGSGWIGRKAGYHADDLQWLLVPMSWQG